MKSKKFNLCDSQVDCVKHTSFNLNSFYNPIVQQNEETSFMNSTNRHEKSILLRNSVSKLNVNNNFKPEDKVLKQNFTLESKSLSNFPVDNLKQNSFLNSPINSLFIQSPLSKSCISSPKIDSYETNIPKCDFNDTNYSLNSVEKNRINCLPLAVDAKNIHFDYNSSKINKNNILFDVNLNIEIGSVYGLLGPSGCGKTSLIKILLGQYKPIYGNVTLFGCNLNSKHSGVPGSSVGYMPQDLCLISHLSIEEHLTYFGRLYCMPFKKIKKEIDYLIKTLDLPEKTRLVDQLSGGQKRRVSFACALIHKPRLLILDEPTVGVDPVLRRNIWNYLINLTKTYKTTILITTHYIEEARKANYVAFLRKGRLLLEDNPNYLIKIHQTNTLEELFLKLCLDQRTKSKAIKEEENIEFNNSYNEMLEKSREKNNFFDETEVLEKVHVDDNLGFNKFKIPWAERYEKTSLEKWFIQFLALITKYFILTKRRPETVLAQYVLPIVAVSVFWVCVGSTPRDIRIAIVNEENCVLPKIMNKQLNPNAINSFDDLSKKIKTMLSKSKFLGYKDLDFIKVQKRSIEYSLNNDKNILKPNNELETTTFINSLDENNSTEKFMDDQDRKEEITNDLLSELKDFSNENETMKNDNLELETTTENFLDEEENIDHYTVNKQFEDACFSNILIEKLNNYVFSKIPYDSHDKAIEDIKRGKLWGLMRFKKGFSRALMSKIFFQDYGDVNISDAIIQVKADLTNQVLTSTLDFSLKQEYPEFIETVLKKATEINLKISSENQTVAKIYNLKSGRLPLILGGNIFGENFTLSDFFGVRDFAAAGLLTILTYSVSFALTVFSLVSSENSDELADRHSCVGLSNNQLILSHLLTRFVFSATGTISVLLISIYVYDVSCRGSFITAASILLCQSYCAMIHGMLISSLCPSLFICAAISNGYLVFVFIISGVLWSLESLPTIIKKFSVFQPSTIPCEALRSIMTRGLGLENQIIQKGFIITFIWIIIFYLLTLFVMNYRKRKN